MNTSHTFLKIAFALLTLPVLAATTPPSFAAEKPVAQLAQTDARLTKLENLILGYINDARREKKLKPLTWNAKLADIARAHSAEMRDKDYFKHESPTKELRNPLDRYRLAFKDSPRLIAENIFRSFGSSHHEVSDKDARLAHDSLMKSPGHRANILLRDITQTGIGIVANKKGDIWVTQMFVNP